MTDNFTSFSRKKSVTDRDSRTVCRRWRQMSPFSIAVLYYYLVDVIAFSAHAEFYVVDLIESR